MSYSTPAETTIVHPYMCLYESLLLDDYCSHKTFSQQCPAPKTPRIQKQQIPLLTTSTWRSLSVLPSKIKAEPVPSVSITDRQIGNSSNNNNECANYNEDLSPARDANDDSNSNANTNTRALAGITATTAMVRAVSECSNTHGMVATVEKDNRECESEALARGRMRETPITNTTVERTHTHKNNTNTEITPMTIKIPTQALDSKQGLKTTKAAQRLPEKDDLTRCLPVWTNNGTHNDIQWHKRWLELYEFYRIHSARTHVRVSKGASAGLQTWVTTQRVTHEQGIMHPLRIQRLNSIGFVWVIQETWEASYNKLAAFARKHQHVNLPKNSVALMRWVRGQRRKFFAGRLSVEQIAKLEALGIDWCPNDSHFQHRVRELVNFKKEHGHMMVPSDHPLNLRNWMNAIRMSRRAGSLSLDRIARLNRIGFEWDI